MAQVLTPSLQASPRVTLQRVRELPVPGKILVKQGQQVGASDSIGHADLPGDLLILRVAESLGIEPFEVTRGLQVSLEDVVKEGDLLCEHAGLFGLFRTRYNAPASGTVELIAERTGHIAVRQASKRLTVDAYIAGEVIAVEESKSVTIESTASFLQGIFGVGGEQHGQLSIMAKPDKTIGLSDLPDQCRGKILVGGKKPSAEVLKIAAERGAVGMIVGSIDDSALASFLGYDLGIALTGDEDVTLSVIITEGFGDLAMSARSYNLLAERDDAQASISGATQVRAGAVRPEVIIPFSGARKPDLIDAVSGGLEVGARIRLIRVPYFGALATVTEMPHQVEKVASGVVTRVLRAELDDSQEVVTVPRANVELLT